MYFYVDESGNTGNNLFDENQPFLYYGLLASRKDLDIVAKTHLQRMRKKLQVDRLHANELGNKGIAVIVEDLIRLQEQYDIRFDMYKINKVDHAAICFFDQVFDSGMNPAVPWTAYWTPLRYFLLGKVAYLFDDELIRESWSARIELNDIKAEKCLVKICKILRERVCHLPDLRSQEIIHGALLWAEKNPGKIAYNAGYKEHALQVSPNLVGFQQVLQGVARHTTAVGQEAIKIIVDQQCEFNKSQQLLNKRLQELRDIPKISGPGMPKPDYSKTPQIDLCFVPSESSVGLEIVDIYLWAIKRICEKKDIAHEVSRLIYYQADKIITDEVSLSAIQKRWSKWFNELPEPTNEQMDKGKEILELQEEKRLQVLKSIE